MEGEATGGGDSLQATSEVKQVKTFSLTPGPTLCGIPERLSPATGLRERAPNSGRQVPRSRGGGVAGEVVSSVSLHVHGSGGGCGWRSPGIWGGGGESGTGRPWLWSGGGAAGRECAAGDDAVPEAGAGPGAGPLPGGSTESRCLSGVFWGCSSVLDLSTIILRQRSTWGAFKPPPPCTPVTYTVSGGVRGVLGKGLEAL